MMIWKYKSKILANTSVFAHFPVTLTAKTPLFSCRWIIQVVWDTDNNKRIDTFVLPTTWVYACAISPSGELLATGGMDNKCTLFRIREGECDSGRESKRSVQCTVLYTVVVHLCADSISFKTFNSILSASILKYISLWLYRHLKLQYLSTNDHFK